VSPRSVGGGGREHRGDQRRENDRQREQQICKAVHGVLVGQSAVWGCPLRHPHRARMMKLRPQRLASPDFRFLANHGLVAVNVGTAHQNPVSGLTVEICRKNASDYAGWQRRLGRRGAGVSR